MVLPGKHVESPESSPALLTEPPAIISESWIDVVVDPPLPFSLLPDRILRTVGNAALHASLSTLQVSVSACSIVCAGDFSRTSRAQPGNPPGLDTRTHFQG